jgi:hypothetical protein
MITLKKAVSSLTALLLLLMVGAPANAAIFSEDFETSPYDQANWTASNGGNGTALQAYADTSIPAVIDSRFVNTVVIDGDPGGGSLLLADGDGNGSNYLYMEYNTAVSRGNHVCCQVASWGNPGAPAAVGGTTLPWTSPVTRPYGPWHRDPDGAAVSGPVGLPQSAILGGVGDGGSTNCKFIATSAWQSGPTIEQAFVDAWDAAIDRASAIYIKVYLGDTDGASGKWSDDTGATWNDFKDTAGAVINLEDSGAASDDPVWLALGGPQSGGGHRFYDNLQIGDDTNPVDDPSSFPIPVEVSGFTVD